MTKTKIDTLADVGQSVWLDYIQRSLITSGGLQAYVNKGLRGVTSNPSLFEKAIAESNEYDEQIQKLALLEKSAEEIYEELTIEDARMAADVLRSVFNETDGNDGYFSLEVNPHLAHDRQGTVNEAIRLFARVDRPNVMIKVPATSEGVLAFQELIEEGININVTLMFSLAQYEQIAEAYITAMENRAAKVYHAKMVYQRYKDYFQSERWQRLAEKGAREQRVLYGSTGTKDPAYADVMYVEGLIGHNTVNTIPPKTLEAFIDHGVVALTLESGLDEARDQLKSLPELGINLYDVTQELLDEGVENFAKPYDALIRAITEKKAVLVTT